MVRPWSTTTVTCANHSYCGRLAGRNRSSLIGNHSRREREHHIASEERLFAVYLIMHGHNEESRSSGQWQPALFRAIIFRSRAYCSIDSIDTPVMTKESENVAPLTVTNTVMKRSPSPATVDGRIVQPSMRRMRKIWRSTDPFSQSTTDVTEISVAWATNATRGSNGRRRSSLRIWKESVINIAREAVRLLFLRKPFRNLK